VLDGGRIAADVAAGEFVESELLTACGGAA
jgi:hypothetical protein